MNSTQSISDILVLLEHGKFDNTAGAELKRLILSLEANAEQGGPSKGELTIKLGVKLTGNGAVKFSPSVTIKEPPIPQTEQVLFTAKNGELVAENPKQQKLPLRNVNKEEAV